MKDGTAPGSATGLTKVLLSGLAASLLGSFVWGAFASISGLELEWLPVLSLGALVGYTVGSVGHGADARVGLVAVLLAQLSCFLGRLWSLWGVIVFQLGYLPQRPFHLPALAALFRAHWTPINLIPYVIAAVEGYHFAMRKPRASRLADVSWRTHWMALVMLGLVLCGVTSFNMSRRSIVDVALSPDGRTLAVGNAAHAGNVDERVDLWDLPLERLRGWVPQPFAGRLAWSPDGQLLAVLGLSGTRGKPGSGQVHLLNSARGPAGEVFLRPAPALNCLAFAPDSQTLATGHNEGICLWDVGQRHRVAEFAHDQPVCRVVFSPDGRQLVAGLRDGTIAVWDLAARQLIHTWAAHPFAVSALAFAPDGRELYSAGSLDAAVKVWDAVAFQDKHSFPVEMDWITGLTFAPNGRLLAVAGGSFRWPGAVALVDPITGKEERRFETHANTVAAAVFTPDGKTLFAGTAQPISPFAWRRDGELYRWDVATGQERPLLR
jgi:WD40 repeat protein